MIAQNNLESFNKRFQTNDRCRKFLFKLKWDRGFCCHRCGHTASWKGRTGFNLRCRQCGYDESVLANTVFHKVKIPLTKAFGILYLITNAKGGCSSVDLARLFGINQKSAWYFKRKVQQALRSAEIGNNKRSSEYKSFFVDSILISGRKPGSNGLQQVQLDVEEFKTGSTKNKQIRATSSLPAGEKKQISELLKGKFNQENPSINMWNFKAWITGTHHHCSDKYLQGYVDEFMFRYTNRHNASKTWHKLIRMLMRRKS
jgi:hypothetical protein